ncbi:MAG: aconitase family protein [Candidatus Gracilibacteria bacterium]
MSEEKEIKDDGTIILNLDKLGDPGKIIITDDSLSCTCGAFCSFSALVNNLELNSSIITGLWSCPPQKVIRVIFVGTLSNNVLPKDLAIDLVNYLTTNGIDVINSVLEIGGNIIDEMSMEGRMIIANIVIRSGATCGMMMIDKTTIDYLYPDFADNQKSDCLRHYQEVFNTDDEFPYEEIHKIVVDNLIPIITDCFSPNNVALVAKLTQR